MKRTNYSVLAGSGFFTRETWKRVYVDADGNRYIKVNGEYKCIEGTKCLEYIVKD